jgi:hypothetical protein
MNSNAIARPIFSNPGRSPSSGWSATLTTPTPSSRKTSLGAFAVARYASQTSYSSSSVSGAWICTATETAKVPVDPGNRTGRRACGIHLGKPSNQRAVVWHHRTDLPERRLGPQRRIAHGKGCSRQESPRSLRRIFVICRGFRRTHAPCRS